VVLDSYGNDPRNADPSTAAWEGPPCHGRVQGVAYRATLQTEAQRLGLAGCVRNRRDGSVEAVVSCQWSYTVAARLG